MAWEPVYITRDELAHYIMGESIDADRILEDAEELDEACESGTWAVNNWCHRQFGQVDAPEARTYTLEWSTTYGMWYAVVDDFMTLTGMVLKFDSAKDGSYATTISNTSVLTRPSNAQQRRRPWERIYFRSASGVTLDCRPDGLQATIQWGWLASIYPTYPPGVKLASKLQAARYFARRNSPYGVAGSPQDGSELRLSAKLDVDLRSSVRRLRRTRWAA